LSKLCELCKLYTQLTFWHKTSCLPASLRSRKAALKRKLLMSFFVLSWIVSLLFLHVNRPDLLSNQPTEHRTPAERINSFCFIFFISAGMVGRFRISPLFWHIFYVPYNIHNIFIILQKVLLWINLSRLTSHQALINLLF